LSLTRFLRGFDEDRGTRYISVFRDLNGDGVPEAIVYLLGRAWCGSGGCTTLILERDNDSLKVLTKVTVTRLPIRVLTKASNGWRSLGVWVEGGGIQPGYEAELEFDGGTYPTNPTVPPARRLAVSSEGDVVIGTLEAAVALYPEYK